MPVDHEVLMAEAQALSTDMIELRRDIHRHPELGLHNPRTQGLIIDALTPLGYEITTGSDISSVVATLTGSEPGPTVVLRADTDALPMVEDTQWDHRSQVEGRAHVCGHDAHVAMLVGAARLLADHRDDLAGTVRLAFQPGEEGAGGMSVMLGEGLLTSGLDNHPDAAFAIHITPNIPVGMIGGRAGSIMASTDDFQVTIRGAGGHASTPHFGNDPIPVAAEIIMALQTLVTRQVNAFDPAVVTVAHVSAGSTSNVIPATAWFEGTIRTVSDHTRSTVTAGFERVVRGVAAAHGCEAEIDLQANYPVTVNNSSVVDYCADLTRSLGGEDAWLELPTPIMGAEDVSYLFQRIPGAMVFLGVCPDDISNSLLAPSCHSNLMRLNERGLPLGAAMHAGFALGWSQR
jgi:amidohydrolase